MTGGKSQRSGIWTGAALGLCLASAVPAYAADAPAVLPSAEPVAVSAQTSTAITIMQADAALQAGDCGKALPLLGQLWNDKALQAQDAALAEHYRFSRVLCTAREQDIKTALTLSASNLDHAGAGMDTYDLHAFLLLSDERPEDAAVILEAALTRFPGDVAKLTDESVVGVLVSLRAKGQTVPPLLDHLQRTHWQPTGATMRFMVDYMRLGGLRAAVDRHDRALADLYRTDLTGNTQLYIIAEGDGQLSDPALVPWPIKTIIRKQINDIGTYVTAHPTDLLALNLLVTLERMNEDEGIALVQIGTILDLIDLNGLDKFDHADSLPDLIIQKATMQAENGRLDAGAETFRAAAARMSGADLFDFNLAYLNYLIDIGRDKDAMTVDGRIDILSLDAAQRRRVAAAEACAAVYGGDMVRYQAALAQTRGRDGIGEMRAYLCAGDVDNAAKALIRDLGDPAQRDSNIQTMQATLPAIAYSPRTKAYHAAFAAVKKRPDVQAAAQAQNIIVRTWPLRF